MIAASSQPRAASRCWRLMIKAMFLPVLMVSLPSQSTRGDSATWKTNPIDNDWHNAANWKPETVPNGPDDVATFHTSDTNAIVVNAPTPIAEMVFETGADTSRSRWITSG